MTFVYTDLSLSIAELSELSAVRILGVPGVGVIVQIFYQTIDMTLLQISIVIVDLHYYYHLLSYSQLYNYTWNELTLVRPVEISFLFPLLYHISTRPSLYLFSRVPLSALTMTSVTCSDVTSELAEVT